MKYVLTLLILGMMGPAVAQPLTSTDANTPATLPGQADFEREVKRASERFERAKRRYEEATERARLNYIKLLEDNVEDRAEGDPQAAEFEKELARVRSLKLHSPKFEYTTYRWENNGPPVKMIHQDEGICYLSGIGGAFQGGAEVARVYVHDDGYWYLHGSTGQGLLVVNATAVKMTR